MLCVWCSLLSSSLKDYKSTQFSPLTGITQAIDTALMQWIIYSKAFYISWFVTWPEPPARRTPKHPIRWRGTVLVFHNERNKNLKLHFIRMIVPGWIAKFNQKWECFVMAVSVCVFTPLSLSLALSAFFPVTYAYTLIRIPTFISDHYSNSSLLEIEYKTPLALVKNK